MEESKNWTRDPSTVDEARDMAIDWQHWMNDQNLSWGELAFWQTLFAGFVKRFPELEDEFRENGIT